jgi:hypothetical protein
VGVELINFEVLLAELMHQPLQLECEAILNGSGLKF